MNYHFRELFLTISSKLPVMTSQLTIEIKTVTIVTTTISNILHTSIQITIETTNVTPIRATNKSDNTTVDHVLGVLNKCLTYLYINQNFDEQHSKNHPPSEHGLGNYCTNPNISSINLYSD